MSKTALPLVIACDTREQRPWFEDEPDVVRTTFRAGDYGPHTLENECAIERKSESDYLASITFGRERLENELAILASYRRACIIVEASFTDVIHWRYRSQVNPSAVVGTIASFHARFNVATIFAGDRRNAQILARRLLEKWWKYFGPNAEAA